jgi:hypothetical protein
MGLKKILCIVPGICTTATFEWYPEPSAPANYPMEIVEGQLIFENGKSVSIPDRQPYTAKYWGLGTRLHLTEPALKPVPTRLKISMFSYAEDRFYSGEFELPKERLLSLFRSGVVNAYENNKRWDVTHIIVGVAPGGHVSVWALAGRIMKEIASVQVAPVDLPWSLIMDNPDFTRQQYINDVLEEILSPEVYKQVKSTPVPIGKWVEFSKRFSWSPKIEGQVTGQDLWIESFNGETEWLDLTGTRKDIDPAPEKRARPQKLSLYWRTAGGQNLTADITLDETESMEAFAKMGATDHSEPMTLILEPSAAATTVDVKLQRGQLVHSFKKAKVEIFKAKKKK